MAAAYGLYTHIQSNKRRSIALLLGLFFLVYLMVFAGALLAEGADAGRLARLAACARRWQDLIWAAPDRDARRRRPGSSSPISSTSR